MCVDELRGFVVVLHQREFARLHCVPGALDGGGTEPDEEVLHRRRVPNRADELAHHAEAARAPDGTLLQVQVARDEPKQRCLAGSVRADEGCLEPVPDPEVDVVEQHPPVGQGMPDTGYVDVSHD